MPIITPTQTTPHILTRDERLTLYVQNIENQINAQFRTNVMVYQNIWRSIFNGQEFTDVEIFNSLGKSAVELLAISQNFGGAINATVANTVPMVPPDALAPQADGSVVVTPAVAPNTP